MKITKFFGPRRQSGVLRSVSCKESLFYCSKKFPNLQSAISSFELLAQIGLVALKFHISGRGHEDASAGRCAWEAIHARHGNIG